MICIWYFSICLSLLVSLECLQTKPIIQPQLTSVYLCQPMYIMKCYSIYWWNICTLVTSQPGGAWIAPFTSARHRHVHFEILNLIYVFLFCSLISLHIFIASASQNFKIHIKKIWKYSLCNYVAQKTHTLCFKMQHLKSFFFFFFGLPSLLFFLAPL